MFVYINFFDKTNKKNLFLSDFLCNIRAVIHKGKERYPMLLIFILSFILFSIFWTSLRIWQMFQWDKTKKAGLFLALCLIWIIPLMLKKGIIDIGNSYAVIYHIFYFLFIWIFLFFLFIFVRDTIWGIGWLIRKIRKKPLGKFALNQPNFLRHSNYVFAGIAVFLSFLALYAGLKTPSFREITITTNKIDSGITIVALSDMHLHQSVSNSKIEKMTKRIQEIQPDVIVFVGDLIDDKTTNLHYKLFKLSQLYAPLGKYAVAGNHEFYIGHEEAKEAIKEADITYLYNEGVQITPNVYLAGIPDYKGVRRISDSADVIRALSSAQNKDYKILLSHRPDFINTLASGQIDLQISGHTHGGQIFPFHIPTKIFNGYLYGLHQTNAGLLYVSRGAGQWGPQMRLFAPAEITVIKLVPEQTTPSFNENESSLSTNTADEKVTISQDITQHKVDSEKEDLSQIDLSVSALQKTIKPEIMSQIRPVLLPLKANEHTDTKTEKQETEATPKKEETIISEQESKEVKIPDTENTDKKSAKTDEQTPSVSDEAELITKEIDSLIASIQQKDEKLSSDEKIPPESKIETDADTELQLIPAKEQTIPNISLEKKENITNQETVDTSIASALSKEDLSKSEKAEPTVTEEHIQREELFVEVEKKDGKIAIVRVYDANHNLIADTELRNGKNVITRTTQGADGNTITQETVLYVHATADKHTTYRSESMRDKQTQTTETQEKLKQKSKESKTEQSTAQDQVAVPVTTPATVPVVLQPTYHSVESNSQPIYYRQPTTGYRYYPIPNNAINYYNGHTFYRIN